MKEYLRNAGEAYLGKIEYDAKAQEYNLAGKSLLELPENSPAASSIREILSKVDGIVKV
jgi:CO dehydrogenase nickel-insertion accessory protein CooC1